MSPPTVVVSPAELGGDRIEIEGDVFQHLFRSRRLAVGARLRVVDGAGRARWAEVAAVERRRGVLELAGNAPSNEPRLAVDLWVGVPRPNRASWLVEKATEVGVGAIRWLDTERSGRALPPAALDRHRRLAVAAVEQSGRSQVPEISGLHSWLDFIGSLDEAVPTVALVGPGDQDVERGELDVAACRRAGAVRLLVGPEGGLAPDELAELDRRRVARLGLGDRVLRVETAAVVAVGLVLWATDAARPSDL